MYFFFADQKVSLNLMFVCIYTGIGSKQPEKSGDFSVLFKTKGGGGRRWDVEATLLFL